MEVLQAVQDLAKKQVMDIAGITYDSNREVLKIITGHQFTDADFLEIGKAVIECACHDIFDKNARP